MGRHRVGKRSIQPTMLPRETLLRAIVSASSERILAQQIAYNLLFGIQINAPVRRRGQTDAV